MPSLAQTLPSNDIGFLRIVASLWGLELASSDPGEAAIELAEGLCDAELLEEVVSTLPAEGRSALEALALENGRMPWGIFARRFGELREMGAGKRDREQPHLRPGSATEILWYRALLAKAFFNAEKGPQEFAFIPADLFDALNFAGLITVPEQEPEPGEDVAQEDPLAPRADISTEKPATSPRENNEALGRPASPAEKAVPVLTSDRILDDACTMLAALRMGQEPPEMRVPAAVLRQFLIASNLIKPSALKPEAVKSFLEAPRERGLEILQTGWQSSQLFNELRQLPGLVFEGSFDNHALVTREFLLDLLEPLPDGQWWSLASFVRDVKTRYPDYQRPAGDYDSWFIKRESDGVFLRGFASWDEIDGALIRYLICGPLHWLGLLDLACPAEGAPPTAFRAHVEPKQPAAGTAKLTVTSQGIINVPRLAPLAARYQVARFCQWEPFNGQEYPYRVTAGSLKRAREQGLKAGHLLTILRKQVSDPLPPSFVKALQRWEQNGSEARIENLVVLKVSRPEVLKELRESKAGRFLGEILGPTTVVIQAGARTRVMAALAELGILAEDQGPGD
jgi:hypothetical protein